MAFWSTTLAVFCFLCVAAAWTIDEFETSASIDLSASGRKPNDHLQKLVAEQMADAALLGHLRRAQTDIEAGESDRADLEQIRDVIEFRLAPKKTANQFRLTVAVTGRGDVTEQRFTRSVVEQLVNQLASDATLKNALSAVAWQHELTQTNLESATASLHRELSQTNEVINQLNRGLSDIHEQVELLRPPRSLNADFSDPSLVDSTDREQIANLLESLKGKLDQIETANNERELNQVGQAIADINQQLKNLELPSLSDQRKPMRVINTSLPEQGSTSAAILDMLQNLDTDAIQTKIGQIQNHLESDARQLREHVGELRNLADKLVESRFVVNGVSEVRAVPRQSPVGTLTLLFFGAGAACCGSLAFRYYRPELDDVGFETVQEAEQLLGIPVIAGIHATEPVPSSRLFNFRFTNVAVRAAEVAFFGIVLLVVSICFLSADIRELFFENPLFAFSKIIQLLY